jgi:hypothetical protein
MPKTKKDIKRITISFKIVKIQTIKFEVLQDIEESNISKLFKSDKLGISINSNINVSNEDSKISIDITSSLYLKEDNSILVTHTGKTVFHVRNLKDLKVKEPEAYNFPQDFLNHIYGLSVTHARALLAMEISPTNYRDKFILPIIDVSKLATSLAN